MDNKLKIINYLGKNISTSYTMRQLSKMLKIPYASFYRAIQEMNDILRVHQVGRAITVQLNRNNAVIISYLSISSYEEKKVYLKNHPIINKIAREGKVKDIVLLFGSYAKRKHTEKSDIDLLIINKDGEKSISFLKYELLYKKKINPIFITNKEFKKMLSSEEENVGKQVLKNHIILNNPEPFWEYVLNAVC
jgi:predicted nucleotidyltransferase